MAERQEVTNGAAVEKTVGFKALKPQLLVEAPKAADAIQFYKAAFGAVEIGRSLYPKRKAEEELPHILTAQLEIGGSIILVSDISSDSAAPYDPFFLLNKYTVKYDFLLMHGFVYVLAA